jgi:glycosyltransferase involved in cell wall biosynthesis
MSHTEHSLQSHPEKASGTACPSAPPGRQPGAETQPTSGQGGTPLASIPWGEVQLAAMEASFAWAIAHRLSRLRRRLAPDGSWRHVCLRLSVHGLRLWRRQGTLALSRRLTAKVVRRFLLPLYETSLSSFSAGDRGETGTPGGQVPVEQVCEQSASETHTSTVQARSAPVEVGRIGDARVPSERRFRVVFVGSGTSEFASLRYRAHHVIEALALVKMEAVFVPDGEALSRLPFILSHDVLVLVRLMHSEVVTALVEAAHRAALPVVYDIDDNLFEPWVLPYVEASRELGPATVLRCMRGFRQALDLCDYFTGSTPFLVERAATRGKQGFTIHNGMSEEQLELSRLAREQRIEPVGEGVRIGYFSGTRTHQADFRVAYPALMALLRDQPNARLVLVGRLDLEEFPGLAPFTSQIERVPLRDWRQLPAEIAKIDINIIPLELTPFNEGKSNLKYYEAGAVMVPSIASPTRILQESIQHGHNGYLARTENEWYDALKELVTRPEHRRLMGQKAHDHVMATYVPAVIAAESVDAYRHIIRLHRSRRGIAEDTLSIVILCDARSRSKDDWASIVHWANGWSAEGHAVTLQALPCEGAMSVDQWNQYITEQFAPPRFAVEIAEEIPCCDVLIATDSPTAVLAELNSQRAQRMVYIPVADKAVAVRVDDPILATIGDGWLRGDQNRSAGDPFAAPRPAERRLPLAG